MKLRPYQEEDASFLSNLQTGGCFNEQRTGKTPTILEVIRKKHFNKVLIICPSSAIPQWTAEYNAWLHLPCTAVLGTPTQKQTAFNNWQHGCVISYDTLKITKNHDGFVTQVLNANPDAVIIDEAHRIKNPKSANAKAIFKLIKIPNRYALTATPAHGKPEEIFSILHFLKPNKYNSYWGFIHDYFKTRRVYLGSKTFQEIVGFQVNMEKTLQKELNTFSTLRKRKDVMSWLPDKDYQQIYLEPTKEQIRYLTDLKQHFETEHIITQTVLDRLIRYRQICLAPALLDLKGKSPKTQWIKEFLTDNPEKSVIIFSKFTSYLKLLQKDLQSDQVGCIIGATPVPKRAELCKAFQNKNKRILLINIDAGKEALTLDQAEVTIFTDKYPPYGDIAQAEDRFVATTQNKKDKEHTIYELILKGTYDETLYELVKQRASSVDVINNYKKYLTKE